MKNAKKGFLLIFPLIIGCILFYAIPIVTIIWKSISNGIGTSMEIVGLKKYIHLMQDEIFMLALKNTVKFLIVSLPLILIISYGIALLLKNQIMQHKVLKTVLVLPYIMPVVGTVLLVENMFINQGILESKHAFIIITLLYIWKNTGYSVIILLAGLATISDENYAAASIDGANSVQQFIYITMPQMWYSVFFATVFSLVNAFKCFREMLLIGGTHPNDNIYMLPHYINNCFENMSYPKLAVASVFFLIILAILFVISYRWVMKKEEYHS